MNEQKLPAADEGERDGRPVRVASDIRALCFAETTG